MAPAPHVCPCGATSITAMEIPYLLCRHWDRSGGGWGRGLGSHGVNDAALQPCYGVTVRVGKTRCGAADKFFLLLIHVTNIVHRSVESKVYLLN